MATWIIRCPHCGHVGDDTESSFNMNLTDECFCPACGEGFELDTSGDDDDEGED